MANKASEYQEAQEILIRALVHLSTGWTDRGYSFEHPDTGEHKYCIIGAIDKAMRELLHQPYRDDHMAGLILQIASLKTYNVSPVTVNDDMGYNHAIHLMAIAIEKVTEYVTCPHKAPTRLKLERVRELNLERTGAKTETSWGVQEDLRSESCRAGQ